VTVSPANARVWDDASVWGNSPEMDRSERKKN
jgi:hypothetical protein